VAYRSGCALCGRALARCEWCGETGLLRDDATGCSWLVEQQPGWDGTYHQPCYQELEQIRQPGPCWVPRQE
jgi:hypothetical protein